MGIFSFNTDYISEKLVPPLLRSTMRLAWIRTLLASIKSKYNDIFGVSSYVYGYSIAKWNVGTNYAIRDRAKDGIAIYEALVANVGIVPHSDSVTWLLVCLDFVGAEERRKLNGQKMVLEYALNRYLNTTATTIPTIYILNNVIDVNGFWMGNGNGQGEYGEMGNSSNQDDFMGISYILNQNAFTIYVPIALANSFTTETANVVPAISTNRENMVRNIADRYVIGGITYNILTY